MAVGAGVADASIAACYTDVEAAYQAMLEDGVEPQKVILYGQSVGTAITAWLANAHPTIAAIILQSPFVSGLAVLDPYPHACCPPSCCLAPLDVLLTQQWTVKSNAPLFVIHGLLDDVIPARHGQKMFDSCKSPKKGAMWIPDAGHNDVVEAGGVHIYEKLRAFLINAISNEDYTPFPSDSGPLPERLGAPTQDAMQERDTAGGAVE